MAYTRPPYKTFRQELNADDWNTYVRDNFEAGAPAIFTTKGDIAVASDIETAIRLPIGNDNYYLRVNTAETAGVGWSSFEKAKMTRASNQSIANATTTTILWNSETFDNGGLANPANGRMTAPSPGIFELRSKLVILRGAQTLAAGEQMWLTLYKNGGALIHLDWYTAEVTRDSWLYMTLEGQFIDRALNAGDYYTVTLTHYIGGAVDVAHTSSFFEMERV